MPVPERDIKHENLDEYLLEKLNQATADQIERIPKALLRRIFKDRKQWEIPDGLTFNDYAAIFNSIGKTVFMVIEDDDKGISTDEFIEVKKAIKHRKQNGEFPHALRVNDFFVVGNAEVAQGLSMFRTAAVSKVWKMSYGLGKTPLGVRNNRYAVWLKAVRHYINGLSNYECNRKAVQAKYGLTNASWYALLYFYHREANPKEFVHGIFSGAYGNSQALAQRAISTLFNLGYLTRRGVHKQVKYTISPAGTEIVDKVISEYMIAGL